MKLRWDPYQVFRHSRTPAGLYARKKWVVERFDSGYQKDFEETVGFLLSGQSADGSWESSCIETVGRLFGLHLTVRDEIEPIRKGLAWLVAQTSIFLHPKGVLPKENISAHLLAGLPFTRGSFTVLISAATAFLSCVFGRENDPDVSRIYERFLTQGSEGSGRWCGWSSYNNILRALVVHPEYSRSEAVTLAAKNLKGMQRKTGRWSGDIPFYQTVNALAHLDLAEGDAQLAVAFERLYNTQRPDGTWSRSQREWHSFLVLHALKNKGEL